MIPRLIGISGKKGSGKDTVADMLSDNLFDELCGGNRNPFYQKKQFAAKLKLMVSTLSGCGTDNLEDQDFKLQNSPIRKGSTKDYFTYRELLQLMGTECGRIVFGPNVWIDALFAYYESDSNWIITDCRFPNEVEVIHEQGGVVLRIERSGMDNSDTHPSECSLDNYSFDHVIINDGTLEELEEKVIEFLAGFNKQ